jgi:hypothetical protein
MTTASARRPVRGIVMALLLVLAVMPAAPAVVGAQSSGSSDLDSARKALTKIPGVKSQIQNLSLTTDPRGDASKGGDAIWGATGQIVLNKKLRNWFKKLVDSPLG